MVEVTRLELATSASRTQRSTKLSHTSKILSRFIRAAFVSNEVRNVLTIRQ